LIQRAIQDATDLKLSEVRDFTINVTVSDGNYHLDDIVCNNCDGRAVKVKEKTGNSITFTIDTNVMLEKGLLPIKKDGDGNSTGGVDFTVYTVEDYLKYRKSVTAILKYRVLTFDCSKAKNADDCVDIKKGNPKMCFWWQEENKCESRIETSICNRLPENLCGPNNKTGSEKCVWNKDQKQCLNPVYAQISDEYAMPKNYTGALPPCAFAGTCRNINDILQLVVNFANGMFMILGAFSFGFFVFGGFTMIISFGSAEKIKTARDMMIAAVVGLVIAIVAGLLVDVLLDVVGVSSEFRAFDL